MSRNRTMLALTLALALTATTTGCDYYRALAGPELVMIVVGLLLEALGVAAVVFASVWLYRWMERRSADRRATGRPRSDEDGDQ